VRNEIARRAVGAGRFLAFVRREGDHARYGRGFPSAVRCVRHQAGEPMMFGSFCPAVPVAELEVEVELDVVLAGCSLRLLSDGEPIRVR